MKDEDDDKDVVRDKSHRRAMRNGGESDWHFEKRSTVLICQNCEARIPIWKKPKFCPECGSGRPDDD
jgi:Zn finger protein HypA/HybF involved in hydrogenase expression